MPADNGPEHLTTTPAEGQSDQPSRQEVRDRILAEATDLQGQMVVRVLTEAEIAVIDQHPELMRQPAELLTALNAPVSRSDAS